MGCVTSSSERSARGTCSICAPTTANSTNADFMLGQRLRPWPNIKSALFELAVCGLIFGGVTSDGEVVPCSHQSCEGCPRWERIPTGCHGGTHTHNVQICAATNIKLIGPLGVFVIFRIKYYSRTISKHWNSGGYLKLRSSFIFNPENGIII